MLCRKSVLFDNETAWTKKNHSSMFDVTMGSFDGAEVCELIGLFLLNNLSEKYGKNNVGLYRDDGLVLLRNASGPQSEWTRKDITREFKKQGLNISISNAPAYRNRSKRCHLCLTEKLYLVRAKRLSLLNKRTELISKCCHKNKFYLANFISCQQ